MAERGTQPRRLLKVKNGYVWLRLGPRKYRARVRDLVDAAFGLDRPPTPKRIARGEKNGRAKLTEDDVREIRRLHAEGGSSQRFLAAKFGVSQPAIRKILKGETWKDVR